MKLFDLIEFQFDHQRKCFVKKQTHKTNVRQRSAMQRKRDWNKTLQDTQDLQCARME
jgi:hypothetical protein